MLLHDDVMYKILQWLPVISLLRFKLVCRTWRALIESNYFIKQHLHHHHYDPNLKDKNHNLIQVTGTDWPFTFPLISIDNFKEPNACVQLDCSDLRESFPLTIHDIVSYNGIVCLNLSNCKGKHSICLWNPATKQSRVLPRLPSLTVEMEYSRLLTIIGFGFDVKNNDYIVVNLFRNIHPREEWVEVYSLNTDSWRSITTDFPFTSIYSYPRMPFNNGTCFFWNVSKYGSDRILCFDFSSEKFRSISFPDAEYFKPSLHASVVSDKIACVFNTNDSRTEIWVFNEYGSVNESWVKLYMIDPSSIIDTIMSVEWLSMNGDHLFLSANGYIIRYNVVTKEIKILSTVEKYKESSTSKDCSLPSADLNYYFSGGASVGFKESLVSVQKGNDELWKLKRK